MSFPRYPKYKDSGVEWLGEVPEHWTAQRLKRLAELVTGITPPTADQESYSTSDGFPWVTPEDLDETGIPTVASKFLSSTGSSLVRKVTSPSALICCIGTIGKLGYSTQQCSTNQQVTAATFKRDARYFYYALHAAKAELETSSTGNVLKILNTERLSRIFLPCPAAGEASSLATFLDRETAKIDALVEEQRRLIELLKEKRQAVISHAVTKGLDPNAPMKDSGVDWLREIPAHWTTRRLNRLITTRKGIAFKAESFTDAGVIVVKASDIKTLTIRQSSTYLPEEFKQLYPQAVLQAGEIVLSTVGSTPDVVTSSVGQLGRLPDGLAGSMLNQNTVVFTSLSPLLATDFLFLALQTTGYRDHLDLHAHGTANQASLNVSDMLNFAVPLPCPADQASIVRFVQKELTQLSALTSQCLRAIDLLQERRSALISAAVTGKIDVRSHAPNENQERA